MFTEIYIEALLVDEELADLVWEAWDMGEIDEATAFVAWWLISQVAANAESAISTLDRHSLLSNIM